MVMLLPFEEPEPENDFAARLAAGQARQERLTLVCQQGCVACCGRLNMLGSGEALDCSLRNLELCPDDREKAQRCPIPGLYERVSRGELTEITAADVAVLRPEPCCQIHSSFAPNTVEHGDPVGAWGNLRSRMLQEGWYPFSSLNLLIGGSRWTVLDAWPPDLVRIFPQERGHGKASSQRWLTYTYFIRSPWEPYPLPVLIAITARQQKLHAKSFPEALVELLQWDEAEVRSVAEQVEAEDVLERLRALGREAEERGG